MDGLISKIGKFSLESKLIFTYELSKHVTDLNGNGFSHGSDGQVFPWVIETFLALSIMYNNDNCHKNILEEKYSGERNEILNEIFNTMHLPIAKYDGDVLTELITPFLSTLEFKSQENMMYLFYRCTYFFDYENNQLNMRQVFFNKMGMQFQEMNEYVVNLVILITSGINDHKVARYISNRFSNVIDLLSCNVDEVRSYYNKIKSTNYLNSVKPFWRTPYIKYGNKHYLACPHLLYRSVTDAMIFRLTENDDKLRALFGKNCLEDYISHLCEKSHQFDEVCKEVEYFVGKDRKHSSDVLVRKGGNAILFESKAYVPETKLRYLNKESIEKSIELISDSIVQLYKQVFYDFDSFYYPFKVKCNIKKIYGIAILMEDSFVRRESVYLAAKSKLEDEGFTVCLEELTSKIIVASLYDLESAVFENTDILEQLIDRSSSDRKYDFINFRNPGGQYSKVYMEFKSKQSDLVSKFANELLENKIISKS